MIEEKKKYCTKCNKLLLLSEFHISKKEKDGRVDKCKSCILDYGKQFWETNRERLLEGRRKYSREYRKKNLEKTLEQSRNYGKSHRKELNEYNYIYKKTHKDEIKEYNFKYRKSPNGKILLKKSKEKRNRNKGFVPLMINPFPDDIQVDYHHINNIIVVPLPKIIHRNNLGKEHIDKCNMWIQKLYCMDVQKILDQKGD